MTAKNTRVVQAKALSVGAAKLTAHEHSQYLRAAARRSTSFEYLYGEVVQAHKPPRFGSSDGER